MRRARQRAAESDVVIVLLSFERATDEYELQLDREVIATAADLAQKKDNVIVAINKSDLARDLANQEGAVHAAAASLPWVGEDRIHLISCKDAEDRTADPMQGRASPDSGNIQAFLHGLIRQFGDLTAAVTPDLAAGDAGDASVWQESLGASERHRLLLERCMAYLDAFVAEVDPTARFANGFDVDEIYANGNEADIVVAAEHLRAAADCLAKITGKGEAGDVEEVLGVVFEKFCVGK